jgi:phosphoglycerate kinase
MLSSTLEDPASPMGAIMGGAKVSDKIDVLKNMLRRVDMLFIGGGMAATFLKAQGYEMGRSPVESERMELALDILRDAEAQNVAVFLPSDLVVTHEFSADAPSEILPVDQVPEDGYVMDIGPATIESFRHGLHDCHTVLWNGPMGVFEFEPFTEGTRAVAETLADLNGAITVVGGGSTAEAVEAMGLTTSMNHVSMGGGAALEFLEGRDLPGVATIPDRESR